MPHQRPTTTKPSTRKHQNQQQPGKQLKRQRQQRAGTAGASLSRAAAKAAKQHDMEPKSSLIIPGEFFFKSFKKQLGEKTGLVTWTHHKEMRKIHCDQIRYSRSLVQMDVDAHKSRVAHTRQLMLDPIRDARVKMLAQRKIKLGNDDLLRRINKRLAEPTPISEAASPVWRKRHTKYKVVRKSLQRIADEEKVRYRNRDNLELLHLIDNAIPHYDPNEWEEAFQRHVRLKKAMRKVDDPEKKKKTKAQKAKERLKKPEKLKTRREALLSELYSHAMSPKFVDTYCDTIQNENNASPIPNSSSSSSSSSSHSGSSGWGSSLLLSSPGVQSPEQRSHRKQTSAGLDGEEVWDDKEQAKLLVMMPQKMNLGGKNVLVGVYRSKDSELALRIVLEDAQNNYTQRSVYLTYKAMHRMTKRYPQLLDDTHSAVRAGKEGKRDKGNRMKSLLLLLDLSGAFTREIVRLPPSINARARTALGGKRSPASAWKMSPGTAEGRRRKDTNLDMSLVIERPRTTSGLRASGSVTTG